jgi:hypothetical protein
MANSNAGTTAGGAIFQGVFWPAWMVHDFEALAR